MKRRLELMPEVLPRPTKVGTSPVRARTLARLRVLAAVGAGIAAACSGKTEGTPGTGGSSSGGSSSGGGTDSGLPNTMRPDSGDPYGVVDPLPRPTCFDGAKPEVSVDYVTASDAGVDASADPDGGATYPARYVRLVVTFTQKDVVIGDITVQSELAKIVEKTATASAIELVLRQTPGVDNIDATINVQTSCAKGPTSLSVHVTDTGTLHADVSYY